MALSGWTVRSMNANNEPFVRFGTGQVQTSGAVQVSHSMSRLVSLQHVEVCFTVDIEYVLQQCLDILNMVLDCFQEP